MTEITLMPLTVTSNMVNFLEGNCSSPCYLMPNVGTVDEERLLNHLNLNLQTFLNLHSTQLLSMKFFTLILAANPSRNLWKYLATSLKRNWVCVTNSES